MWKTWELADVAFVYEHGQIQKEVNLRTAESREFTRAELGVEAAAEAPLKQKLRKMLLGGTP